MSNELLLQKKIENKKDEVLISLINALRRTIMCDVEVYAIDMESTVFYENSALLDNEFLNKRLSLIPIRSDHADVIYENVRVECKIKNNTPEMKSVYVSDFEFKDDKGAVLQKEFCRFPSILFAKLKPNQSISFETRLKKSTSQKSGANFNPTAVCVHTFEIDEAALETHIKEKGMNESEAKSFLLDQAELFYQKGNGGIPSIYNLTLESVGQLLPTQIYESGVEKLRNRILIAKGEMNLKNSEKISITKNKNSDEVYDVVFMDENDTLGNLLSEYLCQDEEVKYIGYRLVHPLKYEMHMKIILHENNDKEHIAKKYIDIMNRILKIMEIL
jgi:DNA-directed RNA polymerase subunit L